MESDEAKKLSENLTEFEVQPIVFKPFVQDETGNMQTLGFLYPKLSRANFAYIQKSSQISHNYYDYLNSLNLKEEYQLHMKFTDLENFNRQDYKLTKVEYQKLRFFYVFMLHMVNHKIPEFMEAIVSSHFAFADIFKGFLKNSSSLRDKYPINNTDEFLIIVPLINKINSKKGINNYTIINKKFEFEIEWEIIENAINVMKSILNSLKTINEDLSNSTKLSKAYDILLSSKKVPVILNVLYDKIQEDGKGVVSTLPKINEEKDAVKQYYFKIDILNTRIPANLYFLYLKIEEMLDIVNNGQDREELRVKCLADENIQLFKKYIGDDDFDKNRDKYYKILKNAITTKSAIRPGANCEKLALLGGAISKLVISQYVFFCYIIS